MSALSWMFLSEGPHHNTVHRAGIYSRHGSGGELMNWEHVVEIQQVVNGYFRALDEKDLDAAHLRRMLTHDAKVIRPNGAAMIEPERIGQSHRESMARFERTQHIISSHDVET